MPGGNELVDTLKAQALGTRSIVALDIDQQLVCDSSLVAGRSRGKHLDALFWANVVASAVLLGRSILSVSIDGVDEGVLSMARLLPPTYWAGFALLLAATFIWYFGGETKSFHLLLVPLWMGFVFLGPELMEAHPRGYSSYGHAWGVAHVLEGREREFLYFPWLGFHYTFAMLAELGDMDQTAMMRVGVVLLELALAAGLIAFFGRVLPDKRSVLVAILVALAMQAAGGGIGFTPHQLAFTLTLFAYCLLSGLDAFPVANRGLLIGLFSAIVVTHGLSALVVVYVVSLTALARWRRPGFGRLSPRTASLSLLFGTIFLAWLLYSSDFWFPKAVRAFRDTVLREPIAFISPFGHVSPTHGGRAEVSLLMFALLAVLLVWLASVVARKRFWNRLGWDRLFPLLTVSGLPVLIMSTGNFSYEGFLRAFFYAGPFLAWFLARESAGRKSAAVFLLPLLGLGFVLLYAREFEELPTSQQFAGANFLVRAAGVNTTVIQGDCMPLGELTNTVDTPGMACPIREYNKPTVAPSASGFSYAVLSEFGERTATFGFGEAWWETLRDSVQTQDFAKIYSNGRYDVFARQAPAR